MDKTTYHHLKDETYYSEMYDRLTIEECRRWENQNVDKLKSVQDKKPEMAALKKSYTSKVVIPVALCFLKGERYREKAQTIREWIVRDRARDEKETNAMAPRGIRCLGCSTLMEEENRTLHTDLDDSKDKVLFFFKCPHCHKPRAFWESGEEWEYHNSCPKCKTDMKSVDSRNGNLITSTYTCPNCQHEESRNLDLDEKKEEKIDPNFEVDRKKYCMTEKEGQEYVMGVEQLKHVTDLLKDHEENKDIYEALAKIKRLTIAELQKLLSSLIENAGYIKFELGKPEISRDVVIEFNAQDNKPDRAEHASKYDLQKIVKKALGNTNWRLMSDGISYRLGFLTGRLRGVEGKENLINLVKREKINYSE